MATRRLPDPVHDSIIQTFEHFDGLSDAEQFAITGLVNGPEKHVGARMDIVQEGEASRVMRLFVKGWGARYRLLEDGRRQVLSFIVPGDLCEPRAFIMIPLITPSRR